MNLRDHITTIVTDAGIDGFTFVRPTRWESLLGEIARRFLKHGANNLQSVWIWDEFHDVENSCQPADPLGYLRQQIEPAEVHWFLASDEHGKYWVAEATGEAVVRVIEEMHGFEYYVVDHSLRWILCENHHGIFIRAKAKPV